MMESCNFVYQIYQKCRKSAGFSQERAAQLLGIAERTLAGYESGEFPVPEDVADRMIDIYRAPMLGYLHMLRGPVGRRYLPMIDDKSLSQATLSLICAAANYMAKQSQMATVAADGIVDSAEAEQWAEVNEAIDAVVKAAFTLKMAQRD